MRSILIHTAGDDEETSRRHLQGTGVDWSHCANCNSIDDGDGPDDGHDDVDVGDHGDIRVDAAKRAE